MSRLYGHEAAVAAFCDGFESGRLHHAWLLAGPHGIGKATFARAIALRILVDSSETPLGDGWIDVPVDHQAAKLFDSGSHPDFHLIERELWDKNKNLIPKHERSDPDEVSRSIRVIQIRWMNAALAQSTSMSNRRVVVIDSADDMEPEAANALLKNLEEPPPSTVFLLISHAPDRLLPTIRSRCRLLRLAPLADDVMTSTLQAIFPDADAEEIAGLVKIGEGAPGRAIAFRGLDIGALDAGMRTLAEQGDPTNARRSALAHSLSLKAARPRYEAFLSRAPAVIARHARERRGAALAEALALWERASALAGNARQLSLDPSSTVFELAGLIAELAPSDRSRAA